jgi:hypothetical protein
MKFKGEIRENSNGGAKEASIPLPWDFHPDPGGFLDANN